MLRNVQTQKKRHQWWEIQEVFTKSKRNLQKKFAKSFFQETEDGAQVQSAKITPKTWFIPEQLSYWSVDFCCSCWLLKPRTLSTQPAASYTVSRWGFLKVMCWWYLAVAHRLFKPRRGMEVFLSVGHAGHAAPQLPQCGKANDFEVCSIERNTQDCTFQGSEVWKNIKSQRRVLQVPMKFSPS